MDPSDRLGRRRRDHGRDGDVGKSRASSPRSAHARHPLPQCRDAERLFPWHAQWRAVVELRRQACRLPRLFTHPPTARVHARCAQSARTPARARRENRSCLGSRGEGQPRGDGQHRGAIWSPRLYGRFRHRRCALGRQRLRQFRHRAVGARRGVVQGTPLP